ncbi:MAG: amino acid adenylation domain-containing protein [Candidatus Riflebacteria bacterium]|nr:amino acid adenylation domain-containing protein [Candidatus Riflebacteria bacterium]
MSQQTLDSNQKFSSRIEIWRQYLAELPEPLNLPCDLARPALLCNSGNSLPIELSETVLRRLIETATAMRIQPRSLLFSTFSVFIGKISNAKDVVVGIHLTDGSLCEPVPVLLQLDPERELSDFSRETDERLSWSLENRGESARDIAKSLGKRTDPARHPLFDVVFQWNDELKPQGTETSSQGESFSVILPSYDLMLAVEPDSKSIDNARNWKFQLVYAEQLFSPSMAKRLARSFGEFLSTTIEARNEITLGNMPLLGRDSQASLLEEFSVPHFNWARHILLHELFEARVDQNPDAMAILYEGESLTYVQLDKKANALAHNLARMGVGPDVIVTLVLERSVEMIIGILAVLKAGGAYLPIDPEAPLDRIKLLVTDSKSNCLVTTRKLATTVSGLCEIVLADEPFPDEALQTRLSRRCEPTNLACVIYTSGSTGLPKGVLLEHRNIVHFVLSEKEAFDIRGDEAVLQFSQYTFDASVEQIWLALASGAKLLLVTKETLLNREKLALRMNEEGVTHLDTVPGFLANLDPEDVPKLKRVVAGGEVCPVSVARKWLGKVKFFNEYGPTETTIASLRYHAKNLSEKNDRVPIGYPIGLTRAYVLDWGGHPVPVGVRGELFIGGAGVARGYLHRPDLTQQKFVGDPFVTDSSARMYRTGDIVCWLQDGSLDFIGRSDHQVKIRGFRIELAEIEAALLKLPGVKSAAVQVFGDSTATKRLCAYFIGATHSTENEIKTQLAESLPVYMIPDLIMQLNHFPQTTSGKIDRKNLPIPVLDTGIVESPCNKVEQELREIWVDLLHLPKERIGVTRSFFELGGHSLLLMQFVARVRQKFSVTINASAILLDPTIRFAAALIADDRRNPGLVIPRTTARDVYPATSVQRRLHAIQQGNPQGTSYNLPTLYEIQGTLSCDQLETACNLLLERQESLRTAFLFQEGQILQKISQRPKFSLDRFELRGRSVEEVFREFVRPFVLENSPLFRAAALMEAESVRFLALDIHHIVSDGISLEILMEDLSSLLRKESPNPIPLRFLDYASWLDTTGAKKRVEESRTYWMNLLREETPILDLPYDFRRPSSRLQTAAEIEIHLHRGVADQIGVCAQRCNSTPFAFFCAVYSLFLSNMSGSPEVVFGFPSANRPHPDLEQVIGMFVNTLVFRDRIDRSATFGEFLGGVMNQVKGSLRNADYPFEELVETLRVQTPPSRNPIFDTMLSYEGITIESIQCGTGSLKQRRIPQQEARMDLVVVIRESGSGYNITFEYSSDLFKRSTVERLAAGFSNIVTAVLKNDSVRLGDLPSMTEAERNRLLQLFNGTNHVLPDVNAAQEIFQQHADSRPVAPCVIFRDKTLTYCEVEQRSNALAHRLLQEGVGRDSIVAILLDPCPEMVISVLGVLKAGGAFLPIDPDYPTERKAFLLTDSSAKVLLYKSPANDELRKLFNGPTFDVSSLPLDQKNIARPTVSVRPEDLAYVIYTSGSTGKPKGVLVEHRNLVNFGCWAKEFLDVCKSDRVSKFAGFGFDASIFEIFPALFSGACLCIVPTETRLVIDELDQYFEQHKVSVAFLPTQFGEQFLRHASRHKLKCLYVGGDKLRLYQPGNCRLVNAYGPTEYTVCTSALTVDKFYDNIPIGKPVWNTQVLILDRFGRLCPIGTAGELCISGAGVARGYLGRPELTAEKFVNHPFELGKRMYRTGDLARWLDDGNIEFLGRIDTQVKIRGFRIELGEIEAALMALSGVKEAIVIARESKTGKGDLALVAFITGSSKSDETGLKEALKKTLPSYMVPSRIIGLESIPLTSNGKVDRKRLPEVTLQQTRMVTPVSEQETELRAMYSRVLGLNAEVISTESGFLELGGHSLKAAALLSELYHQKGVQIRLADFLKSSSIAELAKILRTYQTAPENLTKAFSWTSAPSQRHFPLSSSQSRIFSVHQLSRWSTAYNIPFAFELAHEVDLNRLSEALKELIRRHQSLRASFSVIEGMPVQEFHDDLTFNVEQLTVNETNLRVTLEHFVQPFDLSHPPLFRAAIILTGSRRIFALDIHHIVADGISMSILFQELQDIYQKKPLSKEGPTYADFVWWEQGPAGQEQKLLEKSWWVERFAEMPSQLVLPYDFERPSRLSDEGNQVRLALDGETAEALMELSRRKNITPMSVFLAAYSVVLSRLGNTPDLVIGVPASGRQLPGLEKIVGMFVNTVPLRMNLLGDESFSTWASRVGQESQEAFDRQTYQLNDLVADLGVSRDPSRNPIFDVLFAWESDEMTPGEGGCLGLHEISMRIPPNQFDLEFTVQNFKNGLNLILQYSKKLFRHATAEKFASHLRSVLEQAARDPDTRIRDFEILLPWERETLLGELNRTRVPLPMDLTLVDLFSANLYPNGDQVAVMDNRGSLSFAEVEHKASILAEKLVGRGVRQNDIVALVSERTSDILVGILGIMKAGAGYLPIDPDSPQDRVQLMLKDSGARMLVTCDQAFGTEPDRVIFWKSLDWNGPGLQDSRAVSEGIAYVIYTSGSTGKPKGVVIEHRQVVNFLLGSIDELGVNQDETILLFSSFTFDASMAQIGLAIATGARLVIPTKEDLLDFDRFETLVREKGITHLDAVPLFLSAFVPKAPLPLRRIIVGGDICPIGVASRWSKSCRVFNEYGPTETTISSLRHKFSIMDEASQRLSIGRPIANTRVYILDWTGNLSPLGVPGEVYIGGLGVARGYLNNEELTKERFRSSPFVAGDRIYRTGDLARWRADGSVDFMGRADNQVKIRGFRIELGEIEAALRKHPSVSEAVVLVHSRADSPQLYGYVVPRKQVSINELRGFLGRQLPSYMVPDGWVFMDTLPVMISGKVDRKKLPEPKFDDDSHSDIPASETEERLLDIWADLLKTPRERVPLTRSFFELGGHSLIIMLLITRIHRALGVRLTPSDVFATPTLRGQATLIESRDLQRIVPIPRVPFQEYYPLSSVQRRLFAMNQANPDSVSYNMPTVFAVEGRINMEGLEETIRKLFRRHASFRTTFELREGIPVQYIHNSVDFHVQVLENMAGNLDELMQQLMQPFDLSVAPLARVWLVHMRSKVTYLVVDLHHIIADGISMSILWREATQLLSGLPLAPLQIAYTDFACWQQNAEYRTQVKQQQLYWMKQFSSFSPPLELPFDLRRPKVRNLDGDLAIVHLTAEEHEALTNLSRREGATLFSTLLSCYFVFLSRLTGKEDVTVGIPASGRVHPDIQDVVGMFVNTLPLRSRVPESESFRTFLASSAKMLIESLSHQDYQLEDLVNDLGIQTELGQSPLFDVMFVFQGREEQTIVTRSAKLRVCEFRHRTAKMDLVLIATELEAGLELAFEYPTELFLRRSMERFAKSFVQLVRSILQSPDTPLEEIEILPKDEKSRILTEFNGTQHELPVVSGVHELFDHWVKVSPDAQAVVCGDVKLSYAELNHRAENIAAELGRLKVGRGDIVGILLHPCVEQVPSILGVLKAGAAFLPIDPEYPPGRKDYMLSDSGAKVLLTQAGLDQGLEFSGSRLDPEAVGACKATAKVTDVRPEDAAYVIYTSGSTGKPKGVIVEHRNLLNFSSWYIHYLGITQRDTLSKYAGFAFDASISEVFPACLSGATLSIIPREIRLSLLELNEYFEKTKVSVAFLPTQLGEQFIRLAETHSLRVLILGGDKLHSYRATPYKVMNGYGPTEYTVCTSAFFVEGSFENIPIGKPIWNTQVLILDKKRRLCPIGVPGELCVAGRSMARGYLNRPDLTLEKFVSHPFTLGERLYRTGDLARWLDDGNLEFLGRNDSQVKIRGFRVELGEIEQALLELPGVKEATVIDQTDGSGMKFLVGYLVAIADLDTQQIRILLSRQLPDYLIPAHFVRLPNIPLTPNGKVDRNSLPAVKHESVSIVEPVGEIETRLRDIWAKVLGLEKVSVTTGFFDLGGHSLKAMALVGEIFREFKVNLRISDIFLNPTIRSLAELITQGSQGSDRLRRVSAHEQAKSYPVSSVQKRMYLLQRMEPSDVSYNVASLFKIVSTTVSKGQVEEALRSIVERYEAFRCSFFLEGTEPHFCVEETVCLDFPTIKTSEASLHATVAKRIKPFDLSVAPLARVAWIETESNRFLFFDMHHIVTDGVSMGILVEDLTKLLNGDSLSLPGCGLVDCCVWENRPEVQDAIAQQRCYWEKVFKEGIPALGLLTDYPRSPVPTQEGATIAKVVPLELANRIRDLSRNQGVSLYALFLAAFNVLLARITRQEEVVVGTPVSGRWHVDMQNTFGMFVNTLVLLNRPLPQTTFHQFAREVAHNTIEALDNQAFPFADLVEMVGDGRRPGHSPLFDVMFLLQNRDERIDRDGAIFEPCMVENNTAKFDLTLMVDESRDSLSLAMEYRTSLFRSETIERLLRCLMTLLQDIVARPECVLSSLSILSKEDRQLVDVEFNHTEMSFPPEVAVHRMFERIVQRFPNRRALVDGARSYTYAEMDACANRLAHRLIGLGVMRESIVGILSMPSSELIVAEMAVLKAGGAFMPLDHRYPRDRNEYMLRDSGARVFLAAPGLGDDIDWPGTRLILDKNLMSNGPTHVPEVCSECNDLAYVIYTSGSTGRPKGVAVEHLSLTHFVHRTFALYSLTESDRFSKYAGVAFDASIMETFPPLCCGGELHVVPDEIRLSLDGLEGWFRESGITWAFLPTQLGEEFSKDPRKTALRWLVVGGDRLRRFVPQSFTLSNEYGPTEFTVCATTFFVDKQYENIPIGKPNPNTKAYILDPSDELCPPGVPGELCLAGRGITRGYLGNPELTAKKFVTHAISGNNRMYRTGDLARWLDNGMIEFLGRIDKQVKIRGFRIELGEIEQAILEVPGVRGATVVDLQDASGEKYLCGYYVTSFPVSEQDIRDHLTRKVPEYMVPPALVLLPEIPFNGSGKVDRRRLPEPVLRHRERILVSPRSIADSLVIKAFSLALKRNEISIDDDFFDLGGNSLKAVSAVATLAADFQITPNDLFRLRTARRIADEIPMRGGDLSARVEMLAQSASNSVTEGEILPKEMQPDHDRYLERCRLYKTISLEKREDYRNIFLTGATGFLGSYLLRDILRGTEAKVYLPIRAKTRRDAWERLSARADYYFGPGALENHRRRIILLLADLSEPSMGLDPGNIDSLRQSVDCIIHSAALTKHYGDYSDFVAANVKATENVVNLASSASADFNLVSTVSVGAGEIPGRDAVLFSEFECDMGQTAGNHYVRTKLEAEKLALNLRNTGRVCNIFRVGFLTADSNSGRFQENAADSAFVQKMRGFLELGRIPIGALVHSFCPVNEVSRAILTLFSQSSLANETHHIERLISLAEAEAIGHADPRCEGMDDGAFYRWLAIHLDDPGVSRAATSILLHEGLLDEKVSTQAFEMHEKSKCLLSRLGFEWSPVTAKHVWRMADF